ncbi:hypothetical protein CYR40_14605 [Chimaeribacter arupi]|uniref:YfiM family lipoprotein n=1 Tax=Chimaeribacter arupi TaxID=2060066 RepID=UPI000C7BBDFE|nr:YfiM family lipoprotein [Chimaeribacter arupi]MDV5139307.1 YfiM family lipoprotein [Chimaeribacter arupi]PLR42379.1 hypothetical protein CYR52_21430 [Chimaeribacter arupi]PLR44578.1 hypothetical protein CYR40_14605 [Chimaeribacter arupi]
MGSLLGRGLVLSALLSCGGCSHYAQDKWTGQDKVEHFIGSAALAAAGSAYAEHQHAGQTERRNVGLLFSLSLGVAKEGYDSRPAGSGWSWKDLGWDVAGALAGYTLYDAAN